MRGTELLYKMELIDPVFIESAEAAPQRARSKWLIWGPIAACFFLLIGIFAAVRSGAFPGILAGKTGDRQEIAAALREQYPYAKSGTSTRTPFSKVFPEKGTWLKAGDYVFRAEVAGDWEIYSETAGTGGQDISVSCYLLPVKVTEVLESKEGVNAPSGLIWVVYGMADFNFADAVRFPVGSSFVFVGSPALHLTEYQDKLVVGGDTLLTFYITENDIVLAFGYEPMVDELSGYNYQDFKVQIADIAKKSGWNG